MPDKKLTDSEIVKALECCKNGTLNDCDGCPCFNDEDTDTARECVENLMSNSLDLINRLQEKYEEAEDTIQFADKEIKRLNAENESLKAEKKQANRELSHICRLYDNLKAENEKLKIENSSLSKEIIDTKIEMYKQCIEEMREKIVNTPVDVDLTGKTNEYRAGYLDGLVAKQHNIFDILDNLKEMVGEDK